MPPCLLSTARSEKRGQEAVKLLQKEGLDPKFLQLDITSSESIEAAKKAILAKYGHLDVFVGNAAISVQVIIVIHL